MNSSAQPQFWARERTDSPNSSVRFPLQAFKKLFLSDLPLNHIQLERDIWML